MMLYFDNAATTLNKPPGVAEAVSDAIGRMGNPGRSGHEAATLAQEAVYRCRELAAELFEISPSQVVFTLNATHALNLAIRSLVPYRGKVVVSGFEHNSVTRMLYALRADITVADRHLFQPEKSLQGFERSISRDTDAVIVNHVSNVFGYVQPLEQIARLCYEKGVPLIVDAAQSAGAMPLSAEKLRAAFIAMPGHKALFGPQGTGLLLCGSVPKPLLYGGTGSASLLQSMPEELPERAEAGTLNVPGICGLAEGMRYVYRRGVASISAHERKLSGLLCRKLRSLNGCRVFSGTEQTQLGVVSAVFKDTDCEDMAQYLSEAGIAVRSGLHCAPLAHMSAGTAETGTVRFSFSAMNTETEIDALLAVLARKKE